MRRQIDHGVVTDRSPFERVHIEKIDCGAVGAELLEVSASLGSACKRSDGMSLR
jgi:hypothetical protein